MAPGGWGFLAHRGKWVLPMLPVSLHLCLAVLLLTNPWNVTYRVTVIDGGGAASMVLGPGESTLIPVAVSAPLTVVFRGLGGLPPAQPWRR